MNHQMLIKSCLLATASFVTEYMSHSPVTSSATHQPIEGCMPVAMSSDLCDCVVKLYEAIIPQDVGH